MARAETKMVNVKAELGHKHISKMGFRHIIHWIGLRENLQETMVFTIIYIYMVFL